MKEVVVLSGKGGTGKTSLVGSFAAIAQSKVLADCHVDAAHLSLLLRPEVKEEGEFWKGQVAFVNKENCTHCGLCQKMCYFGVIKDFTVDWLSCQGCGFCSHICPAQAITMKENLAGHWFISETRFGPLVHARLGITQETPGELVALVRQKAKLVAQGQGFDYIISDGPSGIGGSVLSSSSGADLALLVTEPTLSAIQDLERIVGVCHHCGVTAMVGINKYDLNEDNTRHIENYCLSQGIDIASKIPFDTRVIEALVQGLPAVEYCQGGVTSEIERLWQVITKALGK